MKIIHTIWFIFICFGCMSERQDQNLVSLHFVDRQGFSEIVSSKDRLKEYNDYSFEQPQPYQKISRVYRRRGDPKPFCIVMGYHENGQLWQSLEVLGGRAHGKYREWFENGRLHIESDVIEGLGDLTDEAKESWKFDQISRVWDEEGHLIAEIPYQRGNLHGEALYYHADGFLQKLCPFSNNLLEGVTQEFDREGSVIGEITYKKGIKEGKAFLKGLFEEFYKNNLLFEGSYFDHQGNCIEKVENGFGKKVIFEEGCKKAKIEIQEGVEKGTVELFNKEGFLFSRFKIKDGQKNGEEWVYKKGNLNPVLYLNWYEDEIHGITKTWYEEGSLESQREYSHNKKNGVSLGWYRDGSLMFIEEYENDCLLKGKYMKRGDPNPSSKIENGQGIATIYDGDGNFLRKIEYQKGRTIDE